MIRTGVANLPLHCGVTPKWLFKRMVKLSEGIIEIIIDEYGKNKLLKFLSDPFWFQSLSCVLGFDWHSSGCTTVTCGALKTVIKPEKHGIAIAGGKGKISRKTIQQIKEFGEIFNFSDLKIKELQYSSRMSAKIDNNAIQDGHNLYHHVFLFTEDKNSKWAVIQQGMNTNTNNSRRYHWLSGFNSYIIDPHNSIIGEKIDNVLNMTANASISTQKTCVDLVCSHPRHLINDWASLTKLNSQTTLYQYDFFNNHFNYNKDLNMPRSINWNKMKKIYDFQPNGYEELLALEGVGSKTIRALALISELIYGDKPSWNDPVKYCFTVGGKDGVPYPIDCRTMDESTQFLKQGINQAKIGNNEKLRAIKRLKYFVTKNQ